MSSVVSPQILKKIESRIQSFEIGALLQLLNHLGFDQRDVFFDSNWGLSSPNAFCEAIEFNRSGYPKIKITVNMGLLSANSPLPTFFRKKLDEGVIDRKLFKKFISFFDHHLILQSFCAKLLDKGGGHFAWRDTQNYYLKLLALNSISTVSFVLQLCFPELVVNVEKNPRTVQIDEMSLCLGKSVLGEDGCLGKKVDKIAPSYCVYLITDQPQTDKLTPWPQEALERLYKVFFPFFQVVDLHLSVKMVMEDCEELIALSSSPILGYGTLGKGKGALTLHLFSGYARDTV